MKILHGLAISPGTDPENGDLIYFTPWGNIGFYYDADGIGYSDQTCTSGPTKPAAASRSRPRGWSLGASTARSP